MADMMIYLYNQITQNVHTVEQDENWNKLVYIVASTTNFINM